MKNRMLFSFSEHFDASHIFAEQTKHNELLPFAYTYLCLLDCVQNAHNCVYMREFFFCHRHRRWRFCCHYFENERYFHWLALFLFLSLLFIVTPALTQMVDNFSTRTKINSHFSALDLLYTHLKLSICTTLRWFVVGKIATFSFIIIIFSFILFGFALSRPMWCVQQVYRNI